MPFHFDFEKALQAVGVILQNTPGRSMEYLRLLKLLYIADRESLKETGRPITGDAVYAMDHGPVLSEVYSAIEDRSRHSRAWNLFMERDGYTITSTDNPGIGKLSRYEIEKLQDVTDRHRSKGTFALVRLTHTYSEWEKNYRSGTSTKIPMRDILIALEFSDEKINKILNDAESATLAMNVLE